MLNKNIANRQKNSIASNAVLSNDNESNSLTECRYLSSLPKERAKIIDGLHTALEDCLSEEEVHF